MNTKTLFEFNIQSMSDIITNSSSELFVFTSNNINNIIELLDSIYPDWKVEYNTPEQINTMSDNDLRDYLSYVSDLCDLSQEVLTSIRKEIPDSRIALYSKIDNPNFEYQTILSKYAVHRYFLG